MVCGRALPRAANGILHGLVFRAPSGSDFPLPIHVVADCVRTHPAPREDTANTSLTNQTVFAKVLHLWAMVFPPFTNSVESCALHTPNPIRRG